jgi:hypothetical protein
MAIDPNVTDFISQVVSKYGLDPNQTIDVTDPLARLSMAVIITNIEQGRDIYSYDQFVKGSAMSAGLDPDTYNTLINAVSLGFENFQAAGGFVSPATPSVSSGGSSVPTNISNYVQFGPSPLDVVKSTISATDSLIASTQAILSVNSLNLPNPLTGGISAPTTTDNPLSNMFSGIFQKLGLTGGAATTVQNAAQQAADTASAAVRAAGGTVEQAATAAQNAAQQVISRGISGVNGAVPTAGNPDVATVGDSLGVGIVAASPNTLGDKNPNAAYDVLEGRTAAQTLSVVKSDSDLQGTTNAVISVGSNDAANGVNPATFANQIQQIRSTMNSDSYTWVLPAFSEKTAPYINAIKTLAAQNGDKVIQAVAGSPTTDIYHPSGTGYNNLGTEIGKNLVDTSDANNSTYTSPSRNITTTQTAANTDTAKAAEKTANANGYTTKTPIADADGNIVGAVYQNPNDKSYIVYNNVNGQLKNSDGSTIKTAADLPPSLNDTLTTAGYTDKQVLADGTIRFYNSNRNQNDPRAWDGNYVEVTPKGDYRYSGAAVDTVQATYTGKQLDYLNVKQGDIVSTQTTASFAGVPITNNSVDIARSLSISASGTQMPGVGPYGTISGSISAADLGVKFGYIDYSAANNAVKGFTSATTEATNAINNYQLEITSQNNLISSYQTSSSFVSQQIDDLDKTYDALIAAKTNGNEIETQAILDRTNTITQNQNDIQTLNNRTLALNNELTSIEGQIAALPKFSANQSTTTLATATDLASQKFAANFELQAIQKQITEKQQEIQTKNQEIQDIQAGKLPITAAGETAVTINEKLIEIDNQRKELAPLVDQYRSAIDTASNNRDAAQTALAQTNASLSSANAQVNLPKQISDAATDVKASADQVLTLQKLLDNPGIPSSTKADLQDQLRQATDDFNQKTQVYSDLKEQQAAYGQVQGPQVPSSWIPNDSSIVPIKSTSDAITSIAVSTSSSDEASIKSAYDPASYYSVVKPDGGVEIWQGGKIIDPNTGVPPAETLPDNYYSDITSNPSGTNASDYAQLDFVPPAGDNVTLSQGDYTYTTNEQYASDVSGITF